MSDKSYGGRNKKGETRGNTLARHVKRRLEELREVRRPLDLDRFELAEFLAPSRQFVRDTDEQYMNRGNRRGRKIYDGTPMAAAHTLAVGLVGNTCGPAMAWQQNRFPPAPEGKPDLNKNREVRLWLDALDEHMYSVYRRSNFYDRIVPFAEDGVVFGDGQMFIHEDPDRKVGMLELLHPNENFIDEDKFGRVNVHYREFQIGAGVAWEWFGDSLREESIEKARNAPSAKVTIVHAVEPRNIFVRDLDDDSSMKPPRGKGDNSKLNKKYRSIYMELGGDDILTEGGFDVFPYVDWRMMKYTGAYGYGPGHLALLDIIAQNEIMKTTMQATQLQTRPPVWIPGMYRNRESELKAGQLIYPDLDTTTPPRPIFTAGGIQDAMLLLQDRRETIDKHFKTRFFLLLQQGQQQGKQLTATEVNKLAAEQAITLGPEIGRWRTEALMGIHHRMIMIEAKTRRLPKPPDIVLEQGGNLDVVLHGPLATAQRMQQGLQPIDSFLEHGAKVSQMFQATGVPAQGLFDRVDVDKLIEHELDIFDFPEGVLRSGEQVAAMREARAKQAQQAQQMEQMQQMAEAANKGGKAPEPGSLTEKVMPNMGAGQPQQRNFG